MERDKKLWREEGSMKTSPKIEEMKGLGYIPEILERRLYGYEPGRIEIRITGKREGEKNHEELLTEDEAVNVHETQDMFIVFPTKRNREVKDIPAGKYTSKDGRLLSKEEIKQILREHSLHPL